MVDVLLDLLERFGYPVVFMSTLLENTFLVGWLVPGQVVVFTAGLASRFSTLDPLQVALWAAVGETAGNYLSYAFGRWGGEALARRLASRLDGGEKRLAEAMSYFEERGTVALLVGRPAWGIKNILPAVAGMSGMPALKAIGLVTLASVVYYPALVGVAWALGLGVEQASSIAWWLGIVVSAAFVALVVAYVVHKRRERG